MAKTIVDHVSDVLKLTPAQKQRFAGALQTAVAQLPATPPKVTVNFHLMPSTSLKNPPPAGGQVHGFQQELAQLPPAVRTKLAEMEPKVLAWIAAHPQNANQFLMDPMGSLPKAVPGLDPATVKQLATLRGKARTAPETDSFELTSIKLDAKPSGR